MPRPRAKIELGQLSRGNFYRLSGNIGPLLNEEIEIEFQVAFEPKYSRRFRAFISLASDVHRLF